LFHNRHIDYHLELAKEKWISYNTISDLKKGLSSITTKENYNFLEEPGKSLPSGPVFI